MSSYILCICNLEILACGFNNNLFLVLALSHDDLIKWDGEYSIMFCFLEDII